jgi:hypothetical protein
MAHETEGNSMTIVALEDRKPFGLRELAAQNGGSDLDIAHPLELPFWP